MQIISKNDKLIKIMNIDDNTDNITDIKTHILLCDYFHFIKNISLDLTKLTFYDI
jgi:hypothetical protein